MTKLTFPHLNQSFTLFSFNNLLIPVPPIHSPLHNPVANKYQVNPGLCQAQRPFTGLATQQWTVPSPPDSSATFLNLPRVARRDDVSTKGIVETTNLTPNHHRPAPTLHAMDDKLKDDIKDKDFTD